MLHILCVQSLEIIGIQKNQLVTSTLFLVHQRFAGVLCTEGLGSFGRSLVCDMSTKSDNVPRYTPAIARWTNLELIPTLSTNFVLK